MSSKSQWKFCIKESCVVNLKFCSRVHSSSLRHFANFQRSLQRYENDRNWNFENIRTSKTFLDSPIHFKIQIFRLHWENTENAYLVVSLRVQAFVPFFEWISLYTRAGKWLRTDATLASCDSELKLSHLELSCHTMLNCNESDTLLSIAELDQPQHIWLRQDFNQGRDRMDQKTD